jgi:hypothetical protein
LNIVKGYELARLDFDGFPSEFKLPSAVIRDALQTSLATFNAVSRKAAPSAMIELAASVN